MKTVEELRGMRQEDLVRLVQELQEELAKSKESIKVSYDIQYNTRKRLNTLRDTITNVIEMSKGGEPW